MHRKRLGYSRTIERSHRLEQRYILKHRCELGVKLDERYNRIVGASDPLIFHVMVCPE